MLPLTLWINALLQQWFLEAVGGRKHRFTSEDLAMKFLNYSAATER